MKNIKILLVGLVYVLLFNLIGCSNVTQTDRTYTQNNTEDIKITKENNKEKTSTTSFMFDNIKNNGRYLYFDISVSDFVNKYNNSLNDEAEYIANSLTIPDGYMVTGTGVQGEMIYQYDISNNLGGTVRAYAHTNTDGKIVEVVVALEKMLGKPNVNMADILYNDLGKMANCLVGMGNTNWYKYVEGLSNKILNKEASLYYYKDGIVVDTYSNEKAVYYRISCITENLFSEIMKNH